MPGRCSHRQRGAGRRAQKGRACPAHGSSERLGAGRGRSGGAEGAAPERAVGLQALQALQALLALRGALTFMIPFQLSPVDTRKRVRKAMPKLRKVAWRPSPSQGWLSSHSVGAGTAVSPCRPRPPPPPAPPHSPRSPNSSTPRAANMKNNNMKRRPRFPTWKEKKKWGEKHKKRTFVDFLKIDYYFFCSRPVSCCIL